MHLKQEPVLINPAGRRVLVDVLIAAGGTGGHIYPALAAARELSSRGMDVRFAGMRDRMESRIVPEAGFEMEYIHSSPVTGRGIPGAIAGLASMSYAVLKAVLLLRKMRPRVVLGAGGYVSAPVLAAAGVLSIPCALLEQNARPGAANRLMGKTVDRALVSYEETREHFPREKVIVTGNPVRKSIVEAASRGRKSAQGSVRILVLGGSQGAASINAAVAPALAASGLADGVHVLHQAGEGKKLDTEKKYAKTGVNAQVVEFIDDMDRAYMESDMIVCRSGATTLAEISVAGLPAVLVPYPHHADRQQERNAGVFVKAGAAVICSEPLEAEEMGKILKNIITDDSVRKSMSLKMLSLAVPDAAARVADILEELA